MSRPKKKKKTLAEKQEASQSRRSSAEVQALRDRIVAVKKRLPRGAVTMFISQYPEFNGYKASSKVKHVHNLTIVDEAITEKFEALADLYESEKENGNINK